MLGGGWLAATRRAAAAFSMVVQPAATFWVSAAGKPGAIATADWPTPARRPPDSRLDCGRLEAVFGLRLPPWQASLARTVDAVFA